MCVCVCVCVHVRVRVVCVCVYFLCISVYRELFLSFCSFYRYVLQPELSFDENGSVRENAVAVFADLPMSPLFTLSLDVPHSWLVEPVLSPHDLDNIHLAQMDGSVHAEFILEHILVEGVVQLIYFMDSDSNTLNLYRSMF